MDTYQAIFHLTAIDKWPQVLANVTNLLKDLPKDSVEVIVLVNGPAVKSYDSTYEAATFKDKMTRLNEQGVTFKACNNSLNGLELSKDNLYAFVEIVPAGVSELVRKQQEGFAYIKP